jgi:ethanolamine utilization microcompartment shell protein EutL
MSSLAEIEAAVEALPDADREILLRRLVARSSSQAQTNATLVMEDGFAVLVAPPGAPEMTPELVKALQDDVR